MATHEPEVAPTLAGKKKTLTPGQIQQFLTELGYRVEMENKKWAITLPDHGGTLYADSVDSLILQRTFR
jgi:hypothetical protein